MGAFGLAGAVRDLSIGDEVRGTEHGRVCQPHLHRRGRAGIPRGALPFEILGVHPLRLLDCDHVLVHLLSAARDEAGAH